jgi:hypothetical protein
MASELFSNINGTLSAGQVYPNTLIEFPEQGRILVHSSASTHQHGFVSTEPQTWSSILTHEIRTDGFTYLSSCESPSIPFGSLRAYRFQLDPYM